MNSFFTYRIDCQRERKPDFCAVFMHIGKAGQLACTGPLKILSWYNANAATKVLSKPTHICATWASLMITRPYRNGKGFILRHYIWLLFRQKKQT